MYPDLFSIGPFTLHTYGLCVAVGFLLALLVTVKLGKSEGIKPQQTMDMGFLIILGAIIGSRLMYVLINASYYIERPLDMFKIWQGGLVFSGGIICVLLIVIWYTKKHHLSFWKVADLWAPAMAIGQGVGRIGCFMAGCCYGRPSGSKWGVVFTDPHALAPLNIPLFPTQLYSSLSGFSIFFVLILMHSRKKFEGQVFLWLLVLHSTARLFVERFRGDDRGVLIVGGDMSITQLVTLLILIASIVALFIFKRRQTRTQRKSSLFAYFICFLLIWATAFDILSTTFSLPNTSITSNIPGLAVLPVAILGNEDLDVNRIDTASVRLVGISPIRWSTKNVSSPDVCDGSGDGITDLTFKFDTSEIVDAIGDVKDGEEIVLTISGELEDGTKFQGEDIVRILKKGKGEGK